TPEASWSTSTTWRRVPSPTPQRAPTFSTPSMTPCSCILGCTFVAGTMEAVQTVVNTHAQVRTVFSTLISPPMRVAEVHCLLAERYLHDQLDQDASSILPIDDASVAELYARYRGDLRGLLKALDDGIRPNIRSAVTANAD